MAPLAFGIAQLREFAFATNLGVFGQLMNSPLQLLIPLIGAGLGCVTLYGQVGHRYVTLVTHRAQPCAFLTAKLLLSVIVPFIVMFSYVLLIFVVSFVIWPAIGNPLIAPELYPSAGDAAAGGDASSFSYSQLMDLGTPIYGLAYAAWLGLGAAIYAALGAAFLLVIPNRVVAILLPSGIYILETIAAALIGNPYAGLLYSLFPFGLQQAPVLEAALPTLILGALTALLWVWIYRHTRDIPNLR